MHIYTHMHMQANLVVGFLVQSSQEAGVRSAVAAAARCDSQVQALLTKHARRAGMADFAVPSSSGPAAGGALGGASKWRLASKGVADYQVDKQEAEVAKLARPAAARRRAVLRRALWLPWIAVGALLLLCGTLSAWLNWEATKEEEAPGALRLSWLLAVVGSK
mgnify:CR=1 FL=1